MGRVVPGCMCYFDNLINDLEGYLLYSVQHMVVRTGEGCGVFNGELGLAWS